MSESDKGHKVKVVTTIDRFLTEELKDQSVKNNNKSFSQFGGTLYESMDADLNDSLFNNTYVKNDLARHEKSSRIHRNLLGGEEIVTNRNQSGNNKILQEEEHQLGMQIPVNPALDKSDLSINSSQSTKMHPYIVKYLKNKVFRMYPVTSTEVFRTNLPHLIDPNHKPSIIKLIKDLVGKDITRVALPAYMNEPISMLQRFAASFEYKSCLDKGTNAEDRWLRMAYCGAFTLIQYADTVGRFKKPFNPLLGETFELEHDGMRVIGEQVSHHPPISVIFAKTKDYEVLGKLGLNLTKLSRGHKPQNRDDTALSQRHT